MRTTKHAASTCPGCGQRLDASTHPSEDVSPSVGDVTVCLLCGELMEYASIEPCRMARVDLATLPPDVQATVRRYREVLDRGIRTRLL